MFDIIRRKILSADSVSSIRKIHKGKKIVFCSGCFDMLHVGHAAFFSQCKKFGDILVVSVGTDKVLRKLKGPNRPVIPENNRLYLVASLQEVDYALLGGDEVGEGKMDFMENLSNLMPDIFVLNDDDSVIEEKSKVLNRLGIELQFVPRTLPEELTPLSTTEIIDKIAENN